MNNSNDAKNCTLTIKKVFNAPVNLVWNAWTEADQILQWWAPQGMKIKVVEHNFTVGGKWKFSMPMPNGGDFVSEGTYLEIIEHQKIVTSADFKPMTENVELHVSFEADGDKTNFEFSVIHETEEYCKAQEKMGFYNGWGSALNRMEEVISNQLNK
jgi:uncharacterized protein YndB with AHSA1/START domain